jgi:hypothetical protein
VGGAQFLGEREAPRIDVDGDDGRRTRKVRRHEGAESHGADAENGDGGARRQAERVQHGAGPGLQAATEGTE